MVESGYLLGKGRIRERTEKLSERVSEKGRISVSTEKWWNPGEYSKKVESVRGPKNIPDVYLKRVESVSVLENGGIRASTPKR